MYTITLGVLGHLVRTGSRFTTRNEGIDANMLEIDTHQRRP